MRKGDKANSSESLLVDIHGLIYSMTDIINKLNSKISKTQSTLDALEEKIKELKQANSNALDK